MSGEEETAASGDWLSEVVYQLVRVVLILAVLLVGSVVLVPFVVVRLAGDRVAVKARFWVVWRWHWVLNSIGMVSVVMLGVVEVVAVAGWVRHGGATELVSAADWPVKLVEVFGPWVLVNLVAGVLLLPVAWSAHRRRVAQRVRTRRISDVVRQTRIETAPETCCGFCCGATDRCSPRYEHRADCGREARCGYGAHADGRGSVGVRIRDSDHGHERRGVLRRHPAGAGLGRPRAAAGAVTQDVVGHARVTGCGGWYWENGAAERDNSLRVEKWLARHGHRRER